MASSIAWITTALSIDFSRATASAICNSSSLLAATPVAILHSISVRSLRLAFLTCLQTFLNQAIGEHQLRVRHIGEWKSHAPSLVRLCDIHNHVLALEPDQQSLEAPPAVEPASELDPRLVSRKADEVLASRQRSVDAGRGDFEHILFGDRIGSFQHLGERAGE